MRPEKCTRVATLCQSGSGACTKGLSTLGDARTASCSPTLWLCCKNNLERERMHLPYLDVRFYSGH
eukprot:28305-Pelagomonas_calceolata.AAC.1